MTAESFDPNDPTHNTVISGGDSPVAFNNVATNLARGIFLSGLVFA